MVSVAAFVPQWQNLVVMIDDGPQSLKYLLTFKIIYLFSLHWVFIAACGLSLVLVSRDYSSWWYTGFSCWGTWALGSKASVVAARGLGSCGSKSQ